MYDVGFCRGTAVRQKTTKAPPALRAHRNNKSWALERGASGFGAVRPDSSVERFFLKWSKDRADDL